MRKLILFNMITADGYFKGKEEDISWHRVDEEVNEFMIEQLKTTDTLLFGRKTFEVMVGFWRSETAFEQHPQLAEQMSRQAKIVFSTTRGHSSWKNTTWFSENVAEEVKKRKKQPGKDMLVLGSARLCRTFLKNNLIDEFRLMIHPVSLGNGKPFFPVKMELQLLKTKVFGNGNVLLCYRRQK